MRFLAYFAYFAYVTCTSTAQNSAICDIVASTNIRTVSTQYSEWNCQSGFPFTSVCTWTGLSCDGGGNVLSLAFNNLYGLRGFVF